MPGRVRTLPKAKSTNFVRKSDQFLRSAESALERGDWDAVVSHAVHAGISMADALTVFYLGQCSASQDHREVLRLLDSVRFEQAELTRNKRHLSDLLGAKNAAEYEDRMMRESDANQAIEYCARFCEWAREKLPG